VQQRYHPLPVLPAVEDGVGGIGFAKQDLDARNAQYDVFQRRGVQAQLGVLHLRVDDDHIVRFDREQLPAEQKLPLAAEAVEQLRAGMGVDRAVPVAAESALMMYSSRKDSRGAGAWRISKRSVLIKGSF